MELWDVYDRDRNMTGRFHERGRDMRHDDYHLVVQVWIENSKGEWLISKRCPEKPYGGKWETTGGSVVAGENSFEAALREVREELGVSVGQIKFNKSAYFEPSNTLMLNFSCVAETEELHINEKEVDSAAWYTLGEIEKEIFQ